MTEQNDKILVQAVLAGEKAAFEQLYDKYAPLVRAICYDTTKNISDAQDLAQDVFIRAYEKLRQLNQPELFARWIITIARFRSKEWLRLNTKSRSKVISFSEAESIAADPPEHSQIERLREEITKLPEKERLILHTFYLQGKSADEACRILGLSRSGLYLILDRARKQLEQLLTKEPEDTL